jgi:tagatose 1,6-diphosphate aldolase GatY/KbaY
MIFNLISKRQQQSSSAATWGVDSVMVDGSPLPFEENLLFTKEMTEIAHSLGLFVEAELGKLAGEEDGLRVDLKEMKMTDPLTLPRFLQETNVDLLAVTIGNVHGKYASSNPLLDFDRFQEINQQLHRMASNNNHQKIPFLVLHGASGLPMSTIQRCKAMGIVKFNVNTDLRTAAMDYYSQTFQRQQLEKKNVDVLPLMKGSTKVMKAVAMEKIRLFSM